MGIWSWIGRAPQPDNSFCTTQFPQLWTSWVDQFVDFGFNGMPCATPAEAGMPYPWDRQPILGNNYTQAISSSSINSSTSGSAHGGAQAHPMQHPTGGAPLPKQPPAAASLQARAMHTATASARAAPAQHAPPAAGVPTSEVQVEEAVQVDEPTLSFAGPLPTRLPAVSRLIAIGDLHGDLSKAIRAFQLAGLVDTRGRWSGGDTVVVQVGDVLDRGDAELRILYFLERLQAEARAAGGALYVLNGNHETMNVMGNHRYATAGATKEIVRWQRWQHLGEQLRAACPACTTTPVSSSNGSDAATGAGGIGGWLRTLYYGKSKAAGSTAPEHGSSGSSIPTQPPAALGSMAAAGAYGASHFTRTFALQPGSSITSRFFAAHPTVLQVGTTVFVHGGVLPQHVEYGLERINEETRDWMLGHQPPPPPPPASAPGEGGQVGKGAATRAPVVETSTQKPLVAPGFLRGASAIVWARDYSAEDEARCDCDKLAAVLQAIPNAARMVVGHTIQDEGINAACGGRVLRVDVGMSSGCGGGDPEVLEVLKDGAQVRRLREGLPPEDITHSRGSGRPMAQEHEAPPAVTSWLAAVERALANAVRST